MKSFKLGRDAIFKLSVIAVCCVLLAAVNLNIEKISLAVSGTPRQIPIYRVARSDQKAAISFDAAWGNEDTQKLIDILAKYNVKATFFVVGEWVDKYPESVKALHDAGHEIMSHSDSHPHMPALPKEKMRDEIKKTAEKIKKITGESPVLFRPPYGDYNNALIEVLKEEGELCIQWDVDSLDWKDLPADQIAQKVTSKIKPGSIVLFHNAAKNTPEALPKILEAIKAKNIELVKISELVYRENYKIDHTGEQSKLAGKTDEKANAGGQAKEETQTDVETAKTKGRRMSSISTGPKKQVQNTMSPFYSD